jgi:Mn-dependent DtxR family transcriptional regulator
MAAIYQLVEENPGIGASAVARRLQLSDGAVRCTLVSMGNNGFLLSEAGYGKLYAFGLSGDAVRQGKR